MNTLHDHIKESLLDSTPDDYDISKFYMDEKGYLIKDHAKKLIKPDGTLQIPEGVEKIRDNTFESCDNIKSLTLPSTLVYIGYHAFSECSHLDSITFHKDIKDLVIMGGAFKGIGKVGVDLPDGTIEIGSHAFRNSAINSVRIPRRLEKIGEFAFEGCIHLKKVIFESEQIEEISYMCFHQCTSLQEIELPIHVMTLNYGAFGGCQNLRKIVAAGVRNIGIEAFDGCVRLKEVKFGPTIACETRSFANDKSLKDIKTTINVVGFQTFNGCSSLERVQLYTIHQPPKKEVFNGCNGIKEIIVVNNRKFSVTPEDARRILKKLGVPVDDYELTLEK